MDAQSMDRAMFRAERNSRKRFAEFLLKFYDSRIPTLEQMSELFNVPEEEILLAMEELSGEETS